MRSGRRLAALVMITVLVVAALPAQALARPSTDMYRGLAAWVDIYDDDVFARPEAAVREMSLLGVRTIFVETGNSRARDDIHRPDRMARLIRAAHRRDISTVAWYLPTMTDPNRDFRRVAKAIRFRTSDGIGFDSFALDIESTAVHSVAERNRRLLAISKRIRRYAGPSYPLGAIIASPSAIVRNRGYWQPFPFTALASQYDAFATMSYYTYKGEGPDIAYRKARDDVRVLRSQPGCSRKPIHVIGGVGTRSSAAELRGFIAGARVARADGVSFYDWTTSSRVLKRELTAVTPRRVSHRSLPVLPVQMRDALGEE